MRVTFDAHLPKDPAEFADILLIGKDFFVAIEAKWLSDWDYKKDVAENAKRIDSRDERIRKISGDPMHVAYGKEMGGVKATRGTEGQ